MSYNDRILEGVQRFKMENGDIDIYIYSPESLQEAEKIFADWLERPQSSIPVLLYWVAVIMSQWRNFIWQNTT